MAIDFVLIVGQDSNRLASILDLKRISTAMLTAFDLPTATLASVIELRASSEAAHLAWQLGGDHVGLARVERAIASRVDESRGEERWAPLATLIPDGQDRVTFVDLALESGRRYGYRLRVPANDDGEVVGETWLEVPAAAGLALRVAAPVPLSGRISFALELPRSGEARLELFDLAGRRLEQLRIEGREAGLLTVEMGGERGLRAGVHFARLTQGERQVTARFVVAR
ncbi:MAG: hypothetical protein HOP12_13405 [Candidatus Eisenbacteria bacterium]|uniref:T9SS type A sorting domain-containing protein n=1 Tax=Eiseniibacteriota bacterium TaxID=2212470 RepID=A0A849T1G6_UNCEI|nr:hypothetical protein [Candidatus Eisenbacteria bacterium]